MMRLMLLLRLLLQFFAVVAALAPARADVSTIGHHQVGDTVARRDSGEPEWGHGTLLNTYPMLITLRVDSRATKAHKDPCGSLIPVNPYC